VNINNNNNNTKQEEYVKSMDTLFNELDKLNTQIDDKWENLVATQKLYNHEYDEAIPYLKMACSKGSIKAIYNLGICLQRGLGVDKNEKLAFNFFKKAADHGHAEASYNCAIYYLNVLDDYESCLAYLRNASKLNLTKAKKTLAILLIDNDESLDEALNLLISLNAHDAETAFYVGFCYENGFACLENTYKALEWYKKSYELGFEDAKLKLIEIKFKKLGELMTNLMPKSKQQQQLGHFTQSLSKFDTLRRGSLKTSASYSQFPLNDTKQLRRNSSKPILCAY
jgi:TPR repeat protein